MLGMVGAPAGRKGSSDREARVVQVWTGPRQSSRLGSQTALDSLRISL